MKYGLGYANTIPFTDPVPARDLAQATEEAGFESIWTVEHVIWPHDYDSEYPYHSSGKMPGKPSIPIPDPLVWLTWVAANTTRIRLATGVMILPQRNPLILAKQLATLDHLSGGRVELGVGVGWLEEEFNALGVDFTDRGARANEAIEAMRALWRDDSASYRGESVRFSDVAMNPKPVDGSIPIVVGGESRAAARRAARLGDGYYPGPDSLDKLQSAIDLLREECERAGRDPGEIEITTRFPGRFMEDPDAAVSALGSLGVGRVIVPVYEVTRPDLQTGMSAFSEAVGS